LFSECFTHGSGDVLPPGFRRFQVHENEVPWWLLDSSELIEAVIHTKSAGNVQSKRAAPALDRSGAGAGRDAVRWAARLQKSREDFYSVLEK
jgi:hypothetical protein